MSRKAKVSEEEKKKWARPRLTIASLGYDYWKQPADSLIRDTLVFIEHNKQHDEHDHLHVARKMRSSARAILLNPDGLDVLSSTAHARSTPLPPIGNVLYLDLSQLVNPESLKEESASPALQGITKALAKTLQKLHLVGATLAAHGEGAGLLLKVLLGRKAGGGRVLSGEQAGRVLLLHPIIPAAFVNSVIAPAAGPSAEFGGEVTVVYKDERTRDSRHAVIESVMRDAVPLVLRGDDGPDDLLLRCYYDAAESCPDKDSGYEDCTDCCEATTADGRGPDPDATDAMGHRIFYSALGGL